MKALCWLSTLAVMLAIAPSTSFALMSIEHVTPERAKALGLVIRSNSAGDDAVRIELQFETNGELKNYRRVDLELHDGAKLLATSILRDDQSKPGRVIVSFAADRSKLDKFALKIVVQHGMRSLVGYVVRVKNFVDVPPSAVVSPNADAAGPKTTIVQGFVSDVDATTFPGRTVCSATVSEGKLGAGVQTQVTALDPLVQAAILSAADRQVLVEVTYFPDTKPHGSVNRVQRVRLLDQPRHHRSRFISMYPPKATRVLDGLKTSFPEKTLVVGGEAVIAALESCHSEDWGGVKPPTLEDLEKAKKGDHVHFVFSNPIPVEFVGHKIKVSELVYSLSKGLLVRSSTDDKVYYGTKYEHIPMSRFEEWFRHPLQDDVNPARSGRN